MEKTKIEKIREGMELKKSEKEAVDFLAIANKITVNNEKELTAANVLRGGGKALINEIRAGYDEIIDLNYKAWKGSIAKRDLYLKPAQHGVGIINDKMGSYLAKREAKRREVEERARQAREEAERKTREAEEEKQRKIREAEEAGKQEEAEKIAEEKPPVFVPEIVRVPEKVKLEGTHARVHWLYAVVDLAKIPRPFLKPDPVAINRYVQKHKGKANIPGIKVYSRTSMVDKG